MLAEVALHRTVRQPAEGVRDAQAVAVQRLEFDQAQPVQLGQHADAFRFAQAVGFDDLFQAPVPQAADGDQQQARIGDQRGFLREGEGIGLGPGVGRAAQHVFQVDAGGLANLGQARQRHVLLAEHALDAGLAHGDAVGQHLVGDAGGAQFGAQDVEDHVGGAHGFCTVQKKSSNVTRRRV
jgi:hypothetical protein